MHGSRSAALAAMVLVLVVAACTDGERGTGGALPSEPAWEADRPALALYGLGDVGRAVPHPCRGPGYDEFDFWVGKWNVHDPTGARIATSIISSEMDDCLVMEDFIQDNVGFQGKSINVYDRSTGTWHETFVDNVLAQSFRLAGGLQGAEMVMSGSQPIFNFATQTVRQRDVTVFWTPLSEGRVRQRFQTFFDGSPAPASFDGTYIPQQELTRATPTSFPFCQTLFAEFRQLDFWLGSWTVAAEPGPELGRSEVRSDLNGCLMQEDFETPKGYRSRSYLYFDFVVEQWFRTFADNTGAHFELSGNLEGDAMVMTGEGTGPGGQLRPVRVTIEPDRAGSVRQTWKETAGQGVGGGALALMYTP
jgi:hypothetical protein